MLAAAGVALAAPAPSPAAAETAAAAGRPKVCLVLSGGGARGAAHVGVLRVLESLHVAIDCIAGTSMGAIVGAAYASGRSVDELEAAVRGLTAEQLFLDEPARDERPLRRKRDDARAYIGPEFGVSIQRGLALPKGAVSGTALEAVLRRLVYRGGGDESFDALPIPFRAVATDIASGEAVVLGRGDLPQAIRASMSVPGVMAPVDLGGRLLADGGLVRNLPVDVARAMGAQVVIAVNLGTPLMRREQIVSALDVSAQMLNILTEQNVGASLRALGAADVLISPQLGEASAGDFSAMAKLLPAGEAAARAVAERLSALALPAAAWADWSARRRQHDTAVAGAPAARPTGSAATEATQRGLDDPGAGQPPDAAAGAAPKPQVTAPPVVGQIRVVGVQRTSAQAILDSLHVRRGQPLDADAVDADLRRLYAWGDFERLSYALADEVDPQGRPTQTLTIIVREKDWGPDYLRFGLALNAQLGGTSSFDLLLSLRRTWMNALGAEWRTDVQLGQNAKLATVWQQPLQPSHRSFVAPHLRLARTPLDVYRGDQRVAVFESETLAAGVDYGVNLDASSELRLGGEFGRQRFTLVTGEPTLLPASLRVHQGALRLGWTIDTQDNAVFPEKGRRLRAELRASRRDLGADSNHNRWRADAQQAYTLGRHTVGVAVAAGGTLGGAALPVADYFRLGGPLQMSGYPVGRFVGPDYQYLRLTYAGRLLTTPLLRGAFAGFALEAARVASGQLSQLGQAAAVPLDGGSGGTIGSAAAFAGLDSPLGPLYFGVGWAPRGHRTAYLWLGRLE